MLNQLNGKGHTAVLVKSMNAIWFCIIYTACLPCGTKSGKRVNIIMLRSVWLVFQTPRCQPINLSMYPSTVYKDVDAVIMCCY